MLKILVPKFVNFINSLFRSLLKEKFGYTKEEEEKYIPIFLLLTNELYYHRFDFHRHHRLDADGQCHHYWRQSVSTHAKPMGGTRVLCAGRTRTLLHHTLAYAEATCHTGVPTTIDGRLY